MTTLNSYIADVLDRTYRTGTNNHEQHNSNPKYWDILLGDIKNSPSDWNGKVALDFGCGRGRNVTNLLELADFKRVDGIDISQNNIDFCNNNKNERSNFYKNNGQDLSQLESNTYDFVMSTIVFQHICVHELRINLKKEIFRVLRSGGIFSFQMGYGSMSFKGHTNPISYFDNAYSAPGSNGAQDVRVTNAEDLIQDLTKIGFKNITYKVEEPWADGGHPQWIYVRCEK